MSAHSRVFARLVAEHRERLLGAITAGVSDYAQYRDLCGQIYGLDIAMKLSHDADAELSGANIDAAA